MTQSPDNVRRARRAANERARRARNGDVIRAQDRERYAASVERRRARARARYAAKRDEVLEWHRQYRVANREMINAQVRARRAADPERYRAQQRAYYRANKDRLNARNAEIRDRVRDRDSQLRRKHGLRRDEWARIWAEQEGRCYLCGDDLTADGKNGPGKAVLDHLHACCGLASCAACRRGLACSACNIIVGWAQDDPERLRRIADRLEAANALVRERMAAKPAQLTLI